MEKLKKESSSKNWLLIVGSLLFIIGLSFISYDLLSNKYKDNIEEKALKEFYIKESIEEVKVDDAIEEEKVEIKNQDDKEQKIEYIASIKIPKINLERGLVNPNSYLNDIKYNVAFLKDSALPDEENGNVILASHTGTSRVAYFRNLDKLTLDDKVIIEYNKKTYTYSIVNIYDIEKTGTARIIRNPNVKTLTLITCRYKTNKQIVIICELMSEENNE